MLVSPSLYFVFLSFCPSPKAFFQSSYFVFFFPDSSLSPAAHLPRGYSYLPTTRCLAWRSPAGFSYLSYFSLELYVAVDSFGTVILQGKVVVASSSKGPSYVSAPWQSVGRRWHHRREIEVGPCTEHRGQRALSPTRRYLFSIQLVNNPLSAPSHGVLAVDQHHLDAEGGSDHPKDHGLHGIREALL
ncbi:hypothetical protein KSP40_PGU005071 [Platanthera guangdongensis]|uniref:Uncharacterized protein n=1 Tax=Platanthera guangdongensis TaxID=2320717 RepID=A0ABR2M6F2_9ASPA